MNARPKPELPRRRSLRIVALLGVVAGLLYLPAGEPVWADADQGDEPRSEKRRLWGDRISIFGDAIVIDGDTIQGGGVVCVGSTAIVEGEITGDVVVIFGSLELSGTVRGSVVGVLSELKLHGARVRDVLVNAAGALDKQDSDVGQLFNFGLGSWFPGLGTLVFWWRSLRLLVIFVALVLVVAVAPERVRLIAGEAPVRYLPAFFVGLLGYLAFWTVLVLLAVTVIGAVAAWLLFHLFKWLCIAGIFYAVGRGLARALGREISLLGGVLLAFALYALVLLALAPLGLPGLLASGAFGLFFGLMVKVPAVGLLILTRGGTRSRAPAPTGGPAWAGLPTSEPPATGP